MGNSTSLFKAAVIIMAFSLPKAKADCPPNQQVTFIKEFKINDLHYLSMRLHPAQERYLQKLQNQERETVMLNCEGKVIGQSIRDSCYVAIDECTPVDTSYNAGRINGVSGQIVSLANDQFEIEEDDHADGCLLKLMKRLYNLF